METPELKWWLEAECQYVGTEIFFPVTTGGGSHGLEAKQICKVCPVIEACLAAALMEEAGKSREDRFGIRGGLTPHARYKLARQLGQVNDDMEADAA